MNVIWTPNDRKIDVVEIDGNKYVNVHSSMGYGAIYPMLDTDFQPRAEAVLMDLDGTSVKSESFWIWIIQSTIAKLIDKPKFELEDKDVPYVSGHSVSEHLQYCIGKYATGKSIEDARKIYYEIADFEMSEILSGRGRDGAFTPAEGLKDFLYELKSNKIKIGLVTSGLYKKAMPEIISAFKTLKMGDPIDFYDCIITAGFPLGKGMVGTLGELSPKPHPWLYAETLSIGLGIPFNRRHKAIAIEDSSAGIVSIKLAGISSVGISGGNIEQAGMESFCDYRIDKLSEMLNIVL